LAQALKSLGSRLRQPEIDSSLSRWHGRHEEYRDGWPRIRRGFSTAARSSA